MAELCARIVRGVFLGPVFFIYIDFLSMPILRLMKVLKQCTQYSNVIVCWSVCKICRLVMFAIGHLLQTSPLSCERALGFI